MVFSHCTVALTKAGVKLSVEKCQFFFKKIGYLWHIAVPGKLDLDDHITKAIGDIDSRRNVTKCKLCLSL